MSVWGRGGVPGSGLYAAVSTGCPEGGTIIAEVRQCVCMEGGSIDNIRSVSQRNPTQLLRAEPGGAEGSGAKNIYEIEEIRAKNGGALP